MKFTRIALGCAFALLSTAALAQSVIRPVPIPDMSKLAKAEADTLVETRAVFDKTKPNLVGSALAEAYALLASTYTQAGFYDAADVALGNATVVVPDDARWIYLRGLLARMRGDLAASETALLDAEKRLQGGRNAMTAAVTQAELASLRFERGDQADARRRLGAALPVLRASVLPTQLDRIEAEALARKLGL